MHRSKVGLETQARFFVLKHKERGTFTPMRLDQRARTRLNHAQSQLKHDENMKYIRDMASRDRNVPGRWW